MQFNSNCFSMKFALLNFIIIISIYFTPTYSSRTPDNRYNATVVADEIIKWVKTGRQTPKFKKIINDLALPSSYQRADWSVADGFASTILCTVCKSFTKVIINLRRTGTSPEVIERSIAKLCTLFNLQTKEVCDGVVKINTPIILYIVDNDSTIDENAVCGLVLQNQPCCQPPSRYQWTLDIDDNPPQLINVQSSKGDTIKILQITDIHYDPLYEPNGNAGCKEPTCCRQGQNNTRRITKLAGFWGDFNNCDSPWHAVVDALDHLKNYQSDIDYVYFTGDIIDHGVWATSKEGNTESLLKSFRKIKDTFGDVPVYPIFGNHEPHPLNQFAPDYIEDDSLSTRWLYELMANTWIDAGWLPESTKETILRGGFYTLSPTKGFRIIAINNNICYIYNWWLIYDAKDPSGHLKWLEKTLLEAEQNQEFVHILGHIPAGASQCQHTWSREYRRIISRFSHIITAQFNGHTHNDEFNVFYDPQDINKIINIAWNGGSITPYSNLNPNYKVYVADANTYAIEEIDMWIYNLTDANLTPQKRPNWYKLYSFKEEYGLNDLSFESLHQLIVGMAKGSSALETYHKNFFKHAAPELDKGCDKLCLDAYVCRIVSSSSNEKKECQYFQQLQ
ncbi:sphingomyelin phosphodiesterase-like [Chelonus insularis]|uniref:sphingomyelin phosphodiesterase-like n=1 Tax=Chelonus insularis TaxID=460826 RepID=UPI00158C1476|nr:sphingomyelin phosphodiesterase-like [Chelonus insularis]